MPADKRHDLRTIDARAVYEHIRANPGKTAWGVKQSLGLTNGGIHSVLVTLETDGLLLYEDDNGRLYVTN